MYVQEKAPSLIDPAGPTISLISAEPVFLMAAALNVCGYDEGINESAPVRKQVRAEIDQALTQSANARATRDALCVFIAQHRMTGTDKDIAQYVSLALYLTPAPRMELAAELAEMPPDATQVVGVVPLLKAFVGAVDLHGIWLTVHHIYDEEADKLHGPLSQMIVAANLYLKMPAATYGEGRFIVVIEPMLSPNMVNARIYGTEYVVVVSPADGKIPMASVRDTYLHYVIDPLLFSRSNAVDQEQPILKAISDAPLDYRDRSDTTALNVDCLIKAIEARTMDTGVPIYQIPAGVDRSQLPLYEHRREISLRKAEAVRKASVDHDMDQGYVLTEYFYRQLIEFEKSPASLRNTIGAMVYGMNVDQEVQIARHIEFDKVADENVLQRSKPRQLTGLDLAEAQLADGNVAAASAMAQKVLETKADTPASTADCAHADFILARVALMTGHPEQAVDDFQKTLATSKEQRLLAWSHIYLGRLLDLECNREAAVAEYKEALVVRDWEQDTRLAAERGVKTAFAVPGHACGEDAEDSPADTETAQPAPSDSGQGGMQKPQ
jgi:predicted negative regulator of RcsB-dependent stress response